MPANANHVFVKLMKMFFGNSVRITGSESHLAAVCTFVKVAIDIFSNRGYEVTG
ncbi:hypothetical protein ACSAZL_03890 [Methanosarcina sp. T3]|uniref:hypothetical protein n=1 Tax=Methanosarcina sp. T3 TaxID=3439062 RepID=UPI003F839B76